MLLSNKEPWPFLGREGRASGGMETKESRAGEKKCDKVGYRREGGRNYLLLGNVTKRKGTRQGRLAGATQQGWS
jgi:hypothetical protein